VAEIERFWDANADGTDTDCATEKEVLDVLGIGNLKRSLHAQTGRDVSFMIYRSEQDVALRPGEYVRLELRIEP
jgi:hypothetical protein